MITIHPTEERLNDYVDGELTAPERAGVEAHLAACTACRAEVEGLRDLLRHVAGLPREIAPPPEVWEAVREETVEIPRIGRAAPWGARWGIAAAVVVAALSSGITAALLRAPAGEATLAPVTVRPVVPETQAAMVDFRRAEAGYAATAADLEAALHAGRDRLSPETLRVIEDNLRTIDAAIREARSALARDPASAELPHVLDATYRDKIDVLERAVRLSAQT